MYTHVLSMYVESTLAVCSGSKWLLAHSYLGIVSDFLLGRSRQKPGYWKLHTNEVHTYNY